LYTYLLLQDGADYQALEQKLSDYKHKIDPDSESGIRLQPLWYVHLAESLDDTYPTTGKLSFVYMLSGIALLVLVIAWFNYVNLSTAGALKRFKEVGIRKVVGAQRGLQDFAYQATIGWWIFAGAGGVALLVAIFTISFQAIRAATANPVDSLRNE
jgi:putative ABC transport system permease protein